MALTAAEVEEAADGLNYSYYSASGRSSIELPIPAAILGRWGDVKLPLFTPV